jgi:hypothetical protein
MEYDQDPSSSTALAEGGGHGLGLTLAAGRFLLDLPSGTRAAFGRQAFNEAAGFIRLLSAAGPAVAWARVEAQAVRLAVPHEEGGTRLVRVAEGTRPHSWFVYFWKDTLFKDDRVEVLGYFWRDGLLGVFPSACRAEPETMARRAEALDHLFGRLRRRAPLEVPLEPGFCLGGGWFPGRAVATSKEHIEVLARFPRWPGISLRFASDTVGEVIARHPPLLERAFRGPGGQRLRARERRVGPFAGQERVERLGPSGAPVLSFAWESLGRPRDALAPLLGLELRVGPGAARLLAEREVFSLWDDVLDSLRPRENHGNSLRLPDPFQSSLTL